MKFWLLSDNHDSIEGMRLAGIEGSLVADIEQARKAIDSVVENEEIGILLVTSGVYSMCKTELDDVKLSHTTPLVVEIPDRHGNGSETSVTDYIKDAIGVKM